VNIAGYTFEEYLQKVRHFHGSAAPGVLLGGIMVDLARQNLPAEGLFDAISETDKCVPDAIQLLTPCTIGNGWMRILNNGRFALCLYEKRSGEGIRVFVDLTKLKAYSAINNWFFALIPKKEQDREGLTAQIEKAGQAILGTQPVRVNIQSLSSKYEAKYSVCEVCQESYPANERGICLACQGQSYYVRS
jgi:formylmethanofuran dehydrogenase subunit E